MNAVTLSKSPTTRLIYIYQSSDTIHGSCATSSLRMEELSPLQSVHQAVTMMPRRSFAIVICSRTITRRFSAFFASADTSQVLTSQGCNQTLLVHANEQLRDAQAVALAGREFPS